MVGDRTDGRAPDELRPVAFELDVQSAPAAACLVAFGATRVVCAVSSQDGAPRWRNRRGWVTSEYAMLPGSTAPRAARERTPRGRTQEIQRLIGRALRAVVDLDALPDVTLTVDCDVLEADGGTRTAAVTGGWVALARGLRTLGIDHALRGQVAGVSVGMVDGRAVLDLAYDEDVAADVDMNVVATADGRLVELQGTAEREPFDRAALDRLVDLGLGGCAQLFDLQRAAVELPPG
ncbi:MAG TPA: ribonuclease PH [Nitriliruptorales bacterium]|nr:ribonuclease PH [Nitriliruptorales bacterium]